MSENKLVKYSSGGELSRLDSSLAITNRLISSSVEYELIAFNSDIPLVIKGYKRSGVIEIRGKAVFNTATEGDNLINKPIIEWIENYLKKKEMIYINFFLEALNTVSAHSMLNVFKQLEYFNKNHNSIQVNWHYSIDNELILEVGNDYSEIIKLPFDFIKI
jgi:hypothetical protein